MDEMWSFVQSKKQQRWLWSAIDHWTGQMLAYILAPHQDAALVFLKQLLAPFGLTHILHQRQKTGFLRLLHPERLDSSLINPVFQLLLRKVQDVS